jgi:hypothetical protein
MLWTMPELPTPTSIDFPTLRAGRLARLQTMMTRYDLPVALLYNTFTCDWLGWKRPA